MRKLYVCDPRVFDAHYVQKGSGFPIYIGSGVQKGHGIGGIFSGLAKMAIPLLKTAGKTLLKSGAQFAGDLVQGKNFKEAAKQRALEAGKTFGRSALSSVRGLTGTKQRSGNKKRKTTTTGTSLRTAKRRRTSKKKSGSDIFG